MIISDIPRVPLFEFGAPVVSTLADLHHAYSTGVQRELPKITRGKQTSVIRSTAGSKQHLLSASHMQVQRAINRHTGVECI